MSKIAEPSGSFEINTSRDGGLDSFTNRPILCKESIVFTVDMLELAWDQIASDGYFAKSDKSRILARIIKLMMDGK